MTALTVRLIARIDMKPTLGAVKGVRYDGLRRLGPAGQLALEYEDQGADEILLLDVTASLYGRPPDLRCLSAVGWPLTIPLGYGGGLRSLEDGRAALRYGADKLALNTAAIARPELITEIAHRFGSQCAVVHVDAKYRAGGWEAYTHGGRQPSGRDAIEWACEAVDLGAGELVLGSVDRDGTRSGLDLDFLGKVLPRVSVPIVLTGGAGSAADVVAGFQAGASGIAVGSLLHGGVTVSEIKAAMQAAGLEVRCAG